MGFDVQGARQSGYSDAEIADYLASQSNFDTAGARSSGYSDAEIVEHLLTRQARPAAPEPARKPYALPTEPETDEERVARWRESDAAGAAIPARMTQQKLDQWGETIRDIPTQLRASAAQTVAGMRAREFAELEGAPSLSKTDRGKSREQIEAERRERTEGELAVAREAGADLQDIGGKDRTLMQRAVGTAATSLMQTGIPLAVGVATRNPVAAAATMQPITAGSSFAEFANTYEDQRNAPPAAVPGQVEAGNIDLTQRPVVKNPDGTISTVRTMSFEEDGKEVLVPTISEDGRTLTNQQAIEQYRQTGRHLGKFADPQSATEFAEALHEQQERAYSPHAREADLKRAALHADIQGLLETGTELLPFSKLFKRGSDPVNKLVEFLATELPGESIATITQAVDRVIATSPPGATAQEVLEGIEQGVKQLPETWASTILAGGAQVGVASVADAATRQRQPDEPDATFDSVPDVPRLPSSSTITVDSAGTARTSESMRASQDADAQEQARRRDLGLDEVEGAVQRRAPVPMPEQRRLPASITIPVDSEGRARTPEAVRAEQERTAAEAQRRRDLGLDEVSRIQRPEARNTEQQVAALPTVPRNVERYQYQRKAKELRGKQIEVRELTEEDFQQLIRPVLSDGVANTLEEYVTKYPTATHVRVVRAPKGVVLDQVGQASTIRPSGAEVRRVQSFDDAESVKFAIERSGNPERRDPNRVDVEKDSLLTAISKLGGLSRDEAVARGLESKHLSHRGHGISLSFRRSGRKFSDMASSLGELGYPITDQETLHEAINSELGGTRIHAGSKTAPQQPATEVLRDERPIRTEQTQQATATEAAPAVEVPAAQFEPQQDAAEGQEREQHGDAAADAGVDSAQSAIDAAANAAATSPTNGLALPTQAQKEAENYKVGDPIKLHGRTIRVENPKGSYRTNFHVKAAEALLKRQLGKRARKTLERAIELYKEGDARQAWFHLRAAADHAADVEGRRPLRELAVRTWANLMPAHYGRILGTTAPDGDHIDVFLGPRSADETLPVVVIDTNQVEHGPNNAALVKDELDEFKVMVGYQTEDAAVSEFEAAYDKGFGSRIKRAVRQMTPEEFRAWMDDPKPAGEQKKPDYERTQVPASDQASWWDKELTHAGRRQLAEMADVRITDKVRWDYLSREEKDALWKLKGKEKGLDAPAQEAPADDEIGEEIVEPEVETVQDGERGQERYRKDKEIKRYLLAKRPRPNDTQRIISYRTEAVLAVRKAMEKLAPQHVIDFVRAEYEWAVERLEELDPSIDWRNTLQRKQARPENPFTIDDIGKTVRPKPGTGWPASTRHKLYTTPSWSESQGKWMVKLSGGPTVDASEFEIDETPHEIIDNSDIRAGEWVVRRGNQNLARFYLSPTGRPVRIEHYFESPSTRDPVMAAIEEWAEARRPKSHTGTIASPEESTAEAPTIVPHDDAGGPTPERSKRLAEWVTGRLQGRAAFTWDELFKQANLHFGGTQAEGKYTPKDAYDAVELGINLYLRSTTLKASASADQARTHVDNLQRLLELIPTQTKRTEEQDEFQQFSTPPAYSYVANWVANVRAGETYVEPSAGIGGLAVFGKNAGATVIVNELAPRRAAILKLLGFDRVLTENAEQLDNVLPGDIRPTVIVMNPPFSSTGGRIRGERKTMNGARHIEQALQRLEPNGRLVAIVGEGMADDRPAFREWWSKIKQQYNVRANVGIDGRGYAKYGTTFDNQLLVIDKTGPTPAEAVTGKFGSVAEVIPRLEGIRNDRPSATSQVSEDVQRQPAEPRSGAPAARQLEGSDGAAGRVPDAVGDQGGGSRGPGERVGAGQRDARKPRRADERGQSAASDGPADQSRRRSDAPSGRAEPSEDAGGRRAAPSGNATAEPGRDSGLSVEAQADARHEGELTDSVFEQYQPQRLKIPGAQPHPGKLVQSAAMASVSPPPPTFTPNLPKEVIAKGMTSLAQLEGVVYAGQSHEQTLLSGERRGFFIGDGTGVGKGREISAIILDNLRRGRKKAIWISEKRGLMKDAQRDFGDIGGNKASIFWHGNTKAAQRIQSEDGVLFSTYATLRSEEKRAANDTNPTAPKTRLQQLIDWAGEGFDGVIVFDEAHNAGNAITMKGKRGVKKASEQAIAVVELQDALPQARIVYVSATGATEVSNLSYAKRLGLWGPGAPFDTVERFINEVSRGGLAAMELVARDLKQMGLYVARSLSFDDVTYSRLEHPLTEIQRDIYNELAKAWQVVLQNVYAALKITGVTGETGKSMNGLAKGKALSAFWGAHQRFFNQIVTAMQMPSVIDQMHKDIEAGHAVVLQLVNTNEATQERKLALRDEEDDLDDLDLTPRENLVQYLKNSFPVLQYEEYEDESGNRRSRPVTDSAGNLVMSKEAIAMRDKLVENIETIRVPDGPLEIVLNEFGPKVVGEVTGRRRRVVRDEKGKSVIENRGRIAAQADADAFQADKKRVLIFSDAGGTGFSFQADLTKQNQRRRMHYLVQPGWRADKAVQGFGRTHRTNQKSAPHYRLVTTDLPAQKRFISSIARRLDQLGALTKGQRDTANQGLFSAKDNLESEYAVDAIHALIQDAYAKKIPDLPFEQFARELGFDSLIDEKTGALNVSKIPPVPQFLNRLLSLTTDSQSKVFSEFAVRMEALIDKAIEEGTLDVGMETLPALDVKVKREDVVYSDPKSGAETKYVELELTQRTEKKRFPRRAAAAYLKNKKSGKVWVQANAGKRTLKSGAVVDNYRMLGTVSDRYVSAPDLLKEADRYDRIPQHEAERLWQQENDALPPTYTEPAHLITGAILPIWDRLPGQIRVVRTQSSDGRRYLGRYINQADLQDVLKRLDVQSTAARMKPADVMRAIMAGAEGELVNGWKLLKSRVSNEDRIEVQTPSTYLSGALRDELKTYGLFFERISWQERLFVPTGSAGEAAMTKLLASKPLAEITNPDDDGGGGGGIALSIRGDEEIDEEFERRKIAFRDKHPLESLQQHFDGIASRWTGAPNLRIVVVDNEYALTPRHFKRIADFDAVGKTLGMMDSRENVAYLFRENASSLGEMESVLFHEVEGHLSVRQFFGDEIVPFLNRVAMVDPAGVKDVGMRNGFYNEDGAPIKGNERLARLLSADEYLAEMAERINSEQRPSIRKLWDYFVSHFAEWARSLGWKTLKPTASEIRGWLIRAQRSLRGQSADAERAKVASDSMQVAADATDAALDSPLKTRAGSRASWDSPEPSRLDNVIYTLQDKHIDMKRVQEAITRERKAIDDADDAYLREELFHGRVATRLQRFLDEELKPFLQRVKLAGVSLEELEQYLHARHARERNAQIATINPDMPDGGSGMTNEEAASYLNALDPALRKKFEQLASVVDGITKRTRQTLVGYGLESQATVDAWGRAYRHYVPLHREDMDTGPGTGSGFSVRGPSTKRALGSERRVVDIIANIAMQRERALVRGEKNRVANALIGLARANPNADFWKVDRPPMIRYVDPRTNLVTETVDPNYKRRDNVVVARVLDDEGNVIEHAVVFNPHDERAARMAQSLKNLDVDDLGRFLALSAKITRYFAAMSTQYNPIWGVINLIRDVQGALLNLTSTHLDGAQRQILQDTISALRGIYIDAREVRAGRHPTSAWAQLWEEFQMVGGQTGYRDMFRTSNDRAQAIERELKQMSEGNALQVFHTVRDWLSDFNLVMENAVRLAVYKAGKENHRLSNERAASIAKNISVNFNRKGQVSNQLGALYAFFNANAQGTARMIETLAGPKGLKIIAGGVLLGMAQALMLAAAGFDEEEPPEFIRERNFIIPLPGTDRKYVMIPYPLGFHVLPNIGRVSTELAIHGFRNPVKRLSGLFATMIEAFNPLGGSGWSMQTVTPTPLDPLAALAENKDWTGKPIARQDFSRLDPTPGHTRAKDSASDFSMAAARVVNAVTGGTEYVPGLLSPTPDQLDYLIGQGFGGVGREAGKVLDTADALTSGELPPMHKVPLLGRLYGDAGGASNYSSRFYELVKRANLHKAEIEGRAKDGVDYVEYLADNPEAASAVAVAKAADMVSRMRKAQAEAEEAGQKDVARSIEQGIESVMREVVESSKEARKRAAH